MLNKKIKIIVMVVPAITIILSILLLLSLYTGISQSLGYFPEIGMTDITLDFYKKILHSSSKLDKIVTKKIGMRVTQQNHFLCKFDFCVTPTLFIY
mgnify:CR=1 FL=1